MLMIRPHQILEACACNSMQEVYLFQLILLAAVLCYAALVCSALAYRPGELALANCPELHHGNTR